MSTDDPCHLLALTSDLSLMYFHFPTFGKALRATFSKQHFDWRHAIWAVLFLLSLLLMRGIVSIARGLDHIFFGRFRSQDIRAPVFVIGSPRSGTTLFQRLMELALKGRVAWI